MDGGAGAQSWEGRAGAPQGSGRAAVLADSLRGSLSNYGWLLLGQAGATLALFLTTILLTRHLGPDGYGRYSLFLVVAQILLLPVSAWTAGAVIRFGAEEYLQRGKLARTLTSRWCFIAPAALLVLALAALGRQELARYLELPTAAVGLLAAYVLFQTVSQTFHNGLQAVSKMKHYALLLFADKALTLGGVFLLAGLAGLAVSGVIAVVALAALGTSIIGLLALGPRLALPPEVRAEALRQMYFFSYPLLLGGVVTYLGNYADVLIINHYLRKADVGLYALAYQGFNLLVQLVLLVNVMLGPIVISLYVTGRVDLIRRYVERIVPQGLLLWAAILAVVVAISDPVIRLIFGPGFEAATTPFALLAFGAAFGGLQMLITPVLTAYKLTKEAVAVLVGGAVLNIIVDILLIPRVGIVGGALGTLGAAAFSAAFCVLVVYWRVGGLPWGRLLLLGPPFLLPLAALVVLALSHSPLLSLAAVGLAAVGSLLALRELEAFQEQDLALAEEVSMPSWLRRSIRLGYHFIGGRQRRAKASLK